MLENLKLQLYVGLLQDPTLETPSINAKYTLNNNSFQIYLLHLARLYVAYIMLYCISPSKLLLYKFYHITTRALI